MIAETLRQAIADKEWTISRAAREAEVDRSFLSRLLAGHPPPRARSGHRTAENDPRYEQLARALGLDVDGFLTAVRSEQELRVERGPEEYERLLSGALAEIQRQYDPETVSELNLVVGRLSSAIQQAGGTMDYYRKLLAQPPLARRRRGSTSQLAAEAVTSNHKGRDPLWEDDNLPALCDGLIELSYRCHTVDADVGLDVRFDLAAVLQKLGTRDPAVILKMVGLET